MKPIFLTLAVLQTALTPLAAPAADVTTATHFTYRIQGTVTHVREGNFWGIVGGDGKKYDPGDLPEHIRQAGLVVDAEVTSTRPRPARMWGKPIEVIHIEAADAHAHHHAASEPTFQRSVRDYQTPAVRVREATRGDIMSNDVFETDKTVVVSFIFTSCTAICPILTSTLTQTRAQLDTRAEELRIISISIDPDYDTPERLRDYAKRFGASGDWQFLTGQRDAIRAIQRGFEADRGDKNNHQPLALVRRAGQRQWIRLEGFTSADELAHEIRGTALN